MDISFLKVKFGKRATWIAFLVAIHGVLVIADTLVGQVGFRHLSRRLLDLDIVVDLPLLLGLTLLYTSLFLRRRKRSAWTFAVGMYLFLVGLNVSSLLAGLRAGVVHPHIVTLVLPIFILAVLWVSRKDFVVRSDIPTFASSLKVAVLVLVTTFLYGTTGFLLMDIRDFHQEISLLSAMHYTVDQFDLTTTPLHAHTQRARLFQDSLSFISISALGFVVASLFQPLQVRYSHQKERADLAQRLVYEAQADSEDFFKLWPQDKSYIFSEDNQALIAYKIQQGVALVVGDPLGSKQSASELVAEFESFCVVNDWRPSFIHITPIWRKRLASQTYQTQLIGKEAVVDIAHFETNIAPTKYFREISNRFTKLGFTTELLQPPHHDAVTQRLRIISDEWLQKPGRQERRLMMGYFTEAYIQQCALFIARDAAGTILAFLNLVPSPVPDEANFDMMRAAQHAPGNINDFLLTSLLAQLHQAGTPRLNMGLSPLVGLEDEPSTLINRTLRFVYSNGDRFYSFRGLYKFKAKYEPAWHERYVAYKGGARGFSRTMRALTKAMRV